MKINNLYFFTALFLLIPVYSFGTSIDYTSINNAGSLSEALAAYESTMTNYINAKKDSITEEAKNTANQHLEKDREWVKSLYGRKADVTAAEQNSATNNSQSDGTAAQQTPEEKEQAEARLAEKQATYEEAKANEQSFENRTLTAVTTAATGIGGMELARGLSEQKADRDAENSMTAYIETMRCTYADGKQVKAGPEEIELPGAYNENLTKYRQEYMALASDLKERKNALGMLPGIESEEILDKFAIGLYDDENIGIEKGAYESLYRAQMLGSETDQAKINAAKDASKKRVMGGAIAAGAGVLVGVVGNSLINGKLGELIKNKQENKKKLTDMSKEELLNYIEGNEELQQAVKNKLGGVEQ